MGKLTGKVAVITGGNSGIGLATAKAFVAEGARVVVFGRDGQTVDSAALSLGENGIGVQGDVTRDADLDRLFRATTETFGKVDIVFVNAGIAELLPLEAVTDEHYDRLFDVNVRGAIKTVQHSLPVLNAGASIILTTSVANEIVIPNSLVYSATKAAVRSLARNLSIELADRNIRVNAVSPGPISTPFFERMGLPDDFESEISKQVPIKRTGRPEEVAKAALFLASSDSSYVIGAEIVVDGGMTQI